MVECLQFWSPFLARHGRKGVNLPELDLWHEWKTEEHIYLNRASGQLQAPSESVVRDDDLAAHGQPDLGEPGTGFTRMPREIMDMIIGYLDRESEISLKFACRYLYNGCGADSAYGLIFKMRIDPDPWVRVAWRLIPEWLPYYTHKPLKTLFCGVCKVRRCRDMFSEDQLTRLPTHRICLKHDQPP